MSGLIDLNGTDLHLERVQELISDEWLWFDRANKKRIAQGKVKRLHCTTFIKMSRSLTKKAQQVALSTPAFEVVLGDVFFSIVSRIKSEEVYSIGIVLESPELLAYKAQCLQDLDEATRLVHDPYSSYGNAGHITLAYIKAEFKEVAEAVAESVKSALVGKRAPVHSFEVVESGSTVATISFLPRA